MKKARVSFDDPEQDPEIQTLRKLEEHHVNLGGQLKQRGFVHGPNGRHTCLVMELLGPSVACVSSKYRNEEDQYRPDTILRASRQLLESIDFAHQAGIVHGDISTTNFVFTCKKPLSWDDELLFETIIPGAQVAHYKGPESKPSNLPANIFQNANWDGWFDSVVEEVRLIDWGASFSKDTTCNELPQPRDLRAPETFFIGSFDYTHDLWRAGTVIYDLVYMVSMFLWSFTPATAIALQISVLGPLPQKWQAKYDEMAKNDKAAALIEEDKENVSIVHTFELQRQKIIKRIEANEFYEI
ncbi:Serine/threonine-protein kinase AFC1 [Paramyrothecium foliicola]|nr:Serine/threonine-protein kinase AFC1 [Paramyrothecium foliicola]